MWGFLGWDTAQSGAAVVFAVAAAFLPRRRDLVGLSASLAAAVVIAFQLGDALVYLYIVWLPFVLVALLARYREPER